MISRPPLHDFTRSRAVVMGTWEYATLDSVEAIRHSYERMVSVLTEPLCGWPLNRLLTLRNVAQPGDLADQLIAEFEAVEDVALFYYVGHGQIDSDDQLCLSLKNSRKEHNRRATTSLPFQAVRNALTESRAATKIVILDCCFSGLATQPANTLDAKVMEAIAGAGAYTMAASEAYNTAWYEADSPDHRPQTYFTKYLAELIENGIPGHPPVLRLHEIFLQVKDNLVRHGLPTPAVRNVNAASDFPFTYNAASLISRADWDDGWQRHGRAAVRAGREPRRRWNAWRRPRPPAVLSGDDPVIDPMSPLAAGRFVPTPVYETAAWREVERLVKELTSGWTSEEKSHSIDYMIDALMAEWLADAREQYAHYIAGVSPLLMAAEANTERAKALAARDRNILSHSVMALESALLRMVGQDRKGRQGD
jgi:hypothetical protein